jgi:hypothetical protein
MRFSRSCVHIRSNDEIRVNYDVQTAGEQLASFIEQRVLNRASWNPVADSLLCTGRSEVLCDFFHEVTIVSLTCRIVVAGTSLLKESDHRPARLTSDASFETEFRDFIRERLSLRPPLSADLIRNAIRAVESARHDATSKERGAFKRWSQRAHPLCYMCGCQLDFSEQDPVTKFTLDHIWPQRFGGDSTEGNWLPACGSCNNKKKRDFASWAMPDVQSVVLGFDPSDNEYTSVNGSHRFALHQLVARKLAIQRRVSLKRALTTLGPWERTPRLIDESDIGDFFNLAIHRSNPQAI